MNGLIHRARRRRLFEFTGAGVPAPDVWYLGDDAPEAEGIALATWADSIGSADLAQGTAGSRPVKRVDAVNGRDGIEFDGTDDFMVAPMAHSTLFHRFVVVRPVLAPTDAFNTIFMGGDAGAPRGYGLDIDRDNGRLDFYSFRATTTGWWSTGNEGLALNQTSLVEVSYDSALTTNVPVIRVNDVAQTVTQQVAPVGAQLAETELHIGHDPDGEWHLHGLVLEFQGYSGVILSAAHRGIKAAEIMAYYGLA